VFVGLNSVILKVPLAVPARGWEGEAGTNYRDPVVRNGAAFRLCCICFCLSRNYHYLSVVPINRFRSNHRHSAADSYSFRFIVERFLAGPPARGGGGCKIVACNSSCITTTQSRVALQKQLLGQLTNDWPFI